MCVAACAPKRVEFPTGAGAPYADAAAIFGDASKECVGARTIQATLALSGKAGTTTLRGNVDAGFEAPDRIRLEGRHPLGRPVFILVATGPQATLYLPRDNRVMRNAAPGEFVVALVGLPLAPAELQALVAGCGFGAADVTAGREYPGGFIAVETGSATAYLRQQEGRWRIVGATRPPLTVSYSEFVGGRASTLRLQKSGSPAADLRVRLSDVNINVTLDANVFAVDVPAGADALTIEELRRAGPLGDQ
jgi:outer membrane lipoprotein-sorting protein